MAELIHTFTSGKMNKDLDERLVPNGEYRDALNLELASSDTSQVGTFQNIKGNLELAYKTYNPVTGVRTSWSSAYISNLTNAICIGSVVDRNTDNIYWFISSDEVSAIAYYNDVTKVVAPLIVDANSILNFSKDYLITGVNILEGILIWTDNQTEPKSITVKDWIGSTPDFLTHSQVYSRAFIEQDITVIRKHPLSPPTISMSSVAREDDAGNTVDITAKTTATFMTLDSNNNAIPVPTGTAKTLTWNQGQTLPFYREGDTLILTPDVEVETGSELAEIRCSIGGIIPPAEGASQTGADVIVLSVGPSTTGGANTNAVTYNVILEQQEPLFEFKFARFATRWKYNNNQVSAYSSFSNTAFLPGKFNYSPKEGYNLGMTNNTRQLTISDFVPSTLPPDVNEIEVLYKATNNPNVYVVDSFKPTDTAWQNNTFEIKTEIITSVIRSNQLLRPYDNVPRRTLAQEVTANRLIYGNYVQNFTLSSPFTKIPYKTDMSVGLFSKPISVDATVAGSVSMDGNAVFPSIKTLRTYQVGVVYMDEFGRNTPVFTSNSASLVVEKASSASANKIRVTLKGGPPKYKTLTGFADFTHYKYYIKETSREYYNLALDRFYDAEDGNVWLSFPSAERNKVDDETFLILKKEHDNNLPVFQKSRYKVIAIENEAPNFLTQQRLGKGNLITNFGGGQGATPTEGGNELQIPKSIFDAAFGAETRTESGLQLRITGTAGQVSDYYKISTFSIDQTQVFVRIVVSPAFGPDVDFATTDNGSNVPEGTGLTLYDLTDVKKAEFTGRFFVKVNSDNILRQKIQAARNNRNTFIRKAIAPLWLMNNGSHFNKDFYGDEWESDILGNKGRIFIDRNSTCEARGLGTTVAGKIVISDATGYGAARTNTTNGHAAGIVERNPRLLEQLNTDGAMFRFVEFNNNGIFDPTGTVYVVKNSTLALGTLYDCSQNGCWVCWDDDWGELSNQYARWTLEYEQLEGGSNTLVWDPTSNLVNFIGPIGNDGMNNLSYVGIEFLAQDPNDNTFSSNTPAVFETEPKEAAELDIYFETPDLYPISRFGQLQELSWFNCYSFGNGVESDRIRDDFNQPVIGDGVKASATLDEPYEEERRATGLIFSQIFNSASSTNNLNQFIQAESITKDVNPEYGSIQKLHTRDTDLITLCENKSMKIMAKKDILFNADGSTNLTSNSAVLGQTVTFQGEFGIATNPESFAEFGFRMYYTDANKGAVLRLSGDGLTDLSDYGMHSFFSDNLSVNNKIIGTWDVGKRNYNITLEALTPYWQQTLGAGEFDRLNRDPACSQFVNTLPTTTTTISFKERVNGFTSRKVYMPEAGAYLNNTYYTFKSGRIWEHGLNAAYNTFYGVGPDTALVGPYYESSFNTILNENPAVVKGYKTLNYSGTDAKEFLYKLTGSERLYTLAQIEAEGLTPNISTETKGWYVSSIVTDLQEGQIKEFLDKEGKKFNYIRGMDTFYVTSCNTNVDTKEFNVQGIGNPSVIVVPPQTVFTVRNQADPDCSTATEAPGLVKQTFTGPINTQFNETIALYSNTCASAVYFTLESNGLPNPSSLNLNLSTGAFTYNPATGATGNLGAFSVRAFCGDLGSVVQAISLKII